MVIRQSNENNLPGSQLRGSQFSWCADGLSDKHWALPGVLLLHWLLICAREISVCVNALYDGRGKCQREKYCAWIWSGEGKTSTIVSWISFMAFVVERHPVNTHYFTSRCQYCVFDWNRTYSKAYIQCSVCMHCLIFIYALFHMLFSYVFFFIDMLYIDQLL